MTTMRYIVNDTDQAVDFYATLGFEVEMHPAPGFAMVRRGDLRLALNTPGGGGGAGQSVAGQTPEPGGWNRIQLEVDDLGAEVERLRAAGVGFRGDIIHGLGGDQSLAEDPSGNLVELFQPGVRPSA